MDTNKKEGNNFLELVRALHKGIKKHGVKKIYRALKDVDMESDGSDRRKILNFIIESVAKKLGKEKALVLEKGNSKDYAQAKRLCILFFRKYLDLSPSETSEYFGRSRQIIYNIENEFKALNPEFKQDASFLKLYNEIDLKISNYVNGLKTDYPA